MLSSLQPGTVYEVGVRSVCSAQKSAYSSTQDFETLLPTPDHVVICIMENRAYDQIIGSSLAAYINSLAIDTSSVLFTQSYALTHPSQPNYLKLYSGSDQGVTSSNCNSTFFTTANLGSQLITAGKSYTTYSEGLPSVGFDGCSFEKYVRRHNPAANWMGTGINQIPTTTNQPFTAFPSSSNYSTLPTVSFVIPDLDHDMHSGGIKVGDMWLQTNLDSYIQWAKANNSLFILTWDEDDDSSQNHIVTIFTGAIVKQGNNSDSINHYNVLRTLEDMFALPYAGSAATSANISGCWKTSNVSCNYVNAPATPGSISGPTNNVCGGSAYSFSCPTVLNATSYNWTLPFGATIIGQGSTSITATMPSSGFSKGNISVNASNCFATSSNQSITVYGIPAKPGNITGPSSVCAYQKDVHYSISAVPGANAYKWLVPSGDTITSGQTTDSITVNYGVNGGKVKVLSKSNCGSSAYRTLVVSMTCRESENAMTPFNIYPNPSADAFQLHVNSDEEFTLIIKDISGRIVDQFQNSNSETFTFAREFPAGIYFACLLYASGESSVMKVVKE